MTKKFFGLLWKITQCFCNLVRQPFQGCRCLQPLLLRGVLDEILQFKDLISDASRALTADVTSSLETSTECWIKLSCYGQYTDDWGTYSQGDGLHLQKPNCFCALVQKFSLQPFPVPYLRYSEEVVASAFFSRTLHMFWSFVLSSNLYNGLVLRFMSFLSTLSLLNICSVVFLFTLGERD